MTDGPNYYRATAEDGSKWAIHRDRVLEDMTNHEETDDKWPRPITERHIADWLGDNADEIDGWFLVEAPEPCKHGLGDIFVFGEYQDLWSEY